MPLPLEQGLNIKQTADIWDELREKWFHNIVFDSLDALEDQLVTGQPPKK